MFNRVFDIFTILFLFVIAILAIIVPSALAAVVIWLLWNYIVVETSHADLQVNFFVVWAACFLVMTILRILSPSK